MVVALMIVVSFFLLIAIVGTLTRVLAVLERWEEERKSRP